MSLVLYTAHVLLVKYATSQSPSVVVVSPSMLATLHSVVVVAHWRAGRACHQHQQTHFYCDCWKKDTFVHLRIAEWEEDKQPAVLPLLHVDLN